MSESKQEKVKESLLMHTHTDCDELVDACDDALALLVPAPLPPLPWQGLVHQLTHLICCRWDTTSLCLWLLGCKAETDLFSMH